jgi:hypothetical protein
MSLLSAVNVVLTSLNLEETTEVDSPDAPVVARAKALILNLNTTMQAEGWWFNRTGEKTYAPDINGNILISSDVIAIQPVDPRFILAIKDDRLYDLSNDTDEFGKSVKLYVTYKIPFADTPPTWQEYLAREAALQLHQSIRGNTGSSATVAQARDKARAIMMSQNTRGNRKSIKNNPYHYRIAKRNRYYGV